MARPLSFHSPSADDISVPTPPAANASYHIPMLASTCGQRAPSPRPAFSSQHSPARRSPRPTLPSLPPVPPPSKLMTQISSTPTSPYASMDVPTFSFFDRQEAVELSQLNQRNYQSLADAAGFDTVVLKQRETDKLSLGKIKSDAAGASPVNQT
ncbi:hypothetical protein JCM10908_005241 [Rhodotorula pacifica]|uniref:uncharacterized protein n=1 Tax=Rhodotorula pacifica TaxID=1495444 RepID=UPI003174BB13